MRHRTRICERSAEAELPLLLPAGCAKIMPTSLGRLVQWAARANGLEEPDVSQVINETAAARN